MAAISIFLIHTYQFFFSPDHGFLFPSRARTCRFFPSCSEYTIDVLRMQGFFKGWSSGIKRVGRCHPWHEGGYDPVSKN